MVQVTHKAWHVYNLATGLFSGTNYTATVTSAEDDMPFEMMASIPAGHSVISGVKDYLSQKVDVSNSSAHVVVDYQPPAPSEEHVWDQTVRRWNLKPEIQLKNSVRKNALTQIAALEAKQPRILRELFLHEDSGAHEMLQQIEEQIVDLRKQL